LQKFWNTNIDLESLTNRILEYLVEKDFEIVKVRTQDGYQILASNSPFFEMAGYVNIFIKGANNGCTVAVEPSYSENISKVSSSLMLITLFGGGYFLLRKLKSREAWIIFEKEFWKYIDKAIQDLLLEHRNH
jgi:hypothetical protein